MQSLAFHSCKQMMNVNNLSLLLFEAIDPFNVKIYLSLVFSPIPIEIYLYKFICEQIKYVEWLSETELFIMEM